jgi:hypothetical protein
VHYGQPPSLCLQYHIEQCTVTQNMYRALFISNNMTFLKGNYLFKPVSIAEQSKASTVYDLLNIEIAGSNPAQGMDVCLRVSVLSCVLVEALCWTDLPTKESYHMSVDRQVH